MNKNKNIESVVEEKHKKESDKTCHCGCDCGYVLCPVHDFIEIEELRDKDLI